MQRETKPGTGALFPNSDEHRSPKSPTHRGKICCPACEALLKLSGWRNTAKSGLQYISFMAQVADDQTVQKPEPDEPGPF